MSHTVDPERAEREILEAKIRARPGKSHNYQIVPSFEYLLHQQTDDIAY